MKALIALLCGTLFGAGLALSGMNDTAKVLGFLDIFGAWDPALLWVMVGAVSVTLIGYPQVLKHPVPRLGEKFYLPTNTVIDKKLLIGASVFGLGWGLYGYCPGPAITALVYLQPEPWVFVFAMAVGMFASRFVVSHLATSS